MGAGAPALSAYSEDIEAYTPDGGYTVRIAGRSKRSKQAVVARPHPGHISGSTLRNSPNSGCQQMVQSRQK
jgi:hypothetical protein